MTRGRRRWGIAILLGIGVLGSYFARVNLSVAQEALHREFGLTNASFGVLSSAFNWTYALLQLPMGALLDRFGVRTLGCIGAFLWGMASFGSALSPGLKSFFASRLLLGIGEAPTFPANAKAIGYWFPRMERSLATSLFDGAAKLGPAIGVLLVGAITMSYGWRVSFAATGVISLLFFAAFYRWYRDPDEDKHVSKEELRFIQEGGANRAETIEAVPGASIGYLIRRRKVLGLVIGFFAYNYVFYLALYWLPSYFRSLVDQKHAIAYTSIVWLFAAASDILIGGLLVDTLVKRGRSETAVRQTVLIVGTALGMCIAGAQKTRDPVVAMVWISIALGGLAAAAPVGWSIPSLIAPRNSVGRVGGILNFGNQLAGIFAPIVTGRLAGNDNNFGRAFVVAGVLLAFGICAYVFLLGKIEQVPEPPVRA
jgi:ACS family D-galactonate transporter-like MFS transporter